MVDKLDEASGSAFLPVTAQHQRVSTDVQRPVPSRLDLARLADFVGRSNSIPASAVALDVRPLRGGLEAAAVAHVSAHFADSKLRLRTMTFVVKRLDGGARREVDLYHTLAETAAELAPRLLGVELVETETVYLYLEYVRGIRAWPWRELRSTSRVLAGLAALHARIPDAATTAQLESWNFGLHLQQCALRTLSVFDQAVFSTAEMGDIRQYGRALRRLVLHLPRLRAELLDAQPFGSTMLHGDVHSGNVVIRARAGAESAVLLDWGRARIGSPLEDVSSWLQSLRCWEPEVRRKHDTLLQHYLAARGFSTGLLRSVREAYWLAAACNSLAGALGYQLAVATDTTTRPPRERVAAVAAMRQHLRVIRRADAIWRA